jgi:hypothetical protein
MYVKSSVNKYMYKIEREEIGRGRRNDSVNAGTELELMTDRISGRRTITDAVSAAARARGQKSPSSAHEQHGWDETPPAAQAVPA